MGRCDKIGHIYNMSIYSAEDRQIITQAMMPKHVLMKNLMRKEEGAGHKP
jgi:hypothetical protein